MVTHGSLCHSVAMGGTAGGQGAFFAHGNAQERHEHVRDLAIFCVVAVQGSVTESDRIVTQEAEIKRDADAMLGNLANGKHCPPGKDEVEAQGDVVSLNREQLSSGLCSIEWQITEFEQRM